MIITFRFACKKIFLFFSILYIIGILLACYIMYHERSFTFERPRKNVDAEIFGVLDNPAIKNIIHQQNEEILKEVEIWGKASIGNYLWQHILGAHLSKTNDMLMQIGKLTVKDLSFTFRTGPGLVPSTAPPYVSHLILILNGRSSDKVKQAKVWLDSLPAFENLKGVILIMLGNEQCDNRWILPYMTSRGGPIVACFLTYDCTLIDNKEFFQWPLGVATYRGFPDVDPKHVDVASSRPYSCNFLGTVYKNSSREKLMHILKSSEKIQDSCLFTGREKWQPRETNETLQNYIKSLLKADLTLSPVGINTECYRIYEALSMGSVPVVENKVTPGICDNTSALTPLRLLKSHGAPLLYVNDWSFLPSILKRDSLISYKNKVLRRTAIVKWYKEFKNSMAKVFINTVIENFFLVL